MYSVRTLLIFVFAVGLVNSYAIDRFKNTVVSGIDNVYNDDQIFPFDWYDCISGLNQADTFGGARKLLARSLDGDDSYSLLAGCIGCTPSFPSGTLAWSIGSGSVGYARVTWDGPGGVCGDVINYNGVNPPIDITDGGRSDAFRVQVGQADLDATFVITVYSGGANRASNIFFKPDLTVTDYRLVLLPFSIATQDDAATAPADFKAVTAITFEILSNSSVDTQIQMLETAPLTTLSKSGAITLDANTDGVANPGDRITFTLTMTNELDAFGASVSNAYLYDDLSATFPYYTLVPGSVTVRGYPGILSGGNIVYPTADSRSFTIVEGNTAGNRRVIVDIGIFPDNYRIVATFVVQVTSLPCCLPTCSIVVSGLPAGCQVAGQSSLPGGRTESCYCMPNIGYECLEFDASMRAQLLAANNGTLYAQEHCVASNLVQLPVFATIEPALSQTVNATSATGGDRIQVTMNVINNGNRDSADQTLSLSFPSVLAVPVTPLPAGWSCSPGLCTRTVTGLTVGAAVQQFPLIFTVQDPSTCVLAPFVFSSTITTSGPCSLSGAVCLDSNLLNNNASSTINLLGQADVSVAIVAQSASVSPAGSVTYTITYRNLGSVQASSVFLIIDVPAGTSYSGVAPTENWVCSTPTGRCTFSAGDLPRAATRTTTFTITYPGPALCNSANIPITVNINTTCPETVTTNNVASVTVPITATPELTLAKGGATTVAVGGTATYSLSYRNIGNREITGVVLTESIPAGSVFDAANSDNRWSCTGASCTLNIGNIGAQSTAASVAFALRVPLGTACGIVSMTNNAVINGTCNGPFSASASRQTAITGQVDVAVTKAITGGVTVVNPGQTAVFAIGYSNSGPRTANGVVITETVPARFSYVALNSSSGWTDTGNGVYTYTVGTLNNGASGSVNFAMRLDGTVPCRDPPKDNIVSISTLCVDGDSNNNNDRVTLSVPIAGQPDLVVTRVTVNPGSVPAGGAVAVTFYYTNAGTATATNSALTVPLPAGLSAGTNPTWAFVNNVFTYAIGDIVPGSTEYSQTLNFVAPATLMCNENSFNGNVSINNDCGDSNPSNNFNSYSFNVVGQYDLWVTKTDNDAVFRQRSTVDYVINYGNRGVRTVDNVVLTETIPGNTTFAPGAGWNCASGTNGGAVCTFTVGTLAPGQEGTETVSMTIVDPLPFGIREVTNRVSIAAPGCGGDSDLTNNEDIEPTPVVGNPDLTIVKVDDGNTLMPTPSGAVVYKITYNNIGDVDAINVEITERVPAYTKFYAAGSSNGWSCVDGAPSNTICTMSIGTVAVNVPRTVDFAVIPYSYVSGQEFALRCPETDTLNSVSIMGDSNQEERDTTNNDDTENTPIGGLPNLRVTKTDNINDNDQREWKRAGDDIVYKIDYSNNGPRESVNSILTETVPPHTTFNAMRSSSGWSCMAGGIALDTCTMSVGNLAPGATGSVSFAVTLGPFPADVTSTLNVVAISNDCGEADSSDNIDEDTTPLIGFFDLIVQKHGHCDSIIWTMEYQNKGNLTSRLPFIKAHVPADSTFNAAESHASWQCKNITAGSECLLALPPLVPGAGGSVTFTVDTIPSSKATEYTLFTSIDDDYRGEDLDPTPEDNRAQATVGLDGCDTCDSCCPPVDTCCPDQTDVSFNFGGVLDGLRQCS